MIYFVAFPRFLSGRVILLCMLISLVIVACSPEANPPQLLDTTPDSFVRVDEFSYNAGIFEVSYPAGWRIVKTSIDGAPAQVVFVSPDESMTIMLSEGQAEETPSETGIRTQNLVLNGNTIHVRGEYTPDEESAFDQAWSTVIESLQ